MTPKDRRDRSQKENQNDSKARTAWKLNRRKAGTTPKNSFFLFFSFNEIIFHTIPYAKRYNTKPDSTDFLSVNHATFREKPPRRVENKRELW